MTVRAHMRMHMSGHVRGLTRTLRSCRRLPGGQLASLLAWQQICADLNRNAALAAKHPQ